jgi:hypothetical protein
MEVSLTQIEPWSPRKPIEEHRTSRRIPDALKIIRSIGISSIKAHRGCVSPRESSLPRGTQGLNRDEKAGKQTMGVKRQRLERYPIHRMKRKTPRINLSVRGLESQKHAYASWEPDGSWCVRSETSRLEDDVPSMSARNSQTYSPRNRRKMRNHASCPRTNNQVQGE